MTQDEILNRLTGIFRDIFDDETLTITPETSPDDIPEWDSLANISLIAAAEKEFSTRFDMKTVQKIKTAGDLLREVENSHK